MKNSILNLGKTLNEADQKQINGGKIAPDGTFSCYCNGTYAGQASSIQECWNMC